MAVARRQDAEPVDPIELGELFARVVAGDPAARRLWVSSHGSNTKLWLQIEPVDSKHERRFYGSAGVLYDLIPGTYFDLHLLRPDEYDEFVPEEIVPRHSVEIALQAAASRRPGSVD